jgi:hypothetical protein
MLEILKCTDRAVLGEQRLRNRPIPPKESYQKSAAFIVSELPVHRNYADGKQIL